ncbi:MAG TPA: twin-arginine translocase subunit TatC [Thermoleophilaceae bacterium]
MEAFPLRAVAHDEHLTLTEHLGELRVRLLMSVAVLTVLFAGSLWQSRSLLHVLNVPLAQLRTSSAAQGAHGELPRALARSAGAFTRLAHAPSLAPADQRAALNAARSLAAASQSLARPDARAPITLGLGEPFSTSVTVAFAFALLLGLPFLLIQAWAFISPAIAPAERRAVRPLLVCAPVLFATGVAFAYFLVLPPAVKFLQGFNHGAFDVLVQARAYYRFELMTMLALGAMFEIPVLLLALGRVGVLSSATLRRYRRYAIVGLSVLGALLPGTDPVTTLLETLPLFGLYEATIVLLRLSERRRSRRQALSG